MQRKDTWLAGAVGIVLFFFSTLHVQAQGYTPYLNGAEHTGALQLEVLKEAPDTLRYALVAHAASLNYDSKRKRLYNTVERARKLHLNVVKIFSPEHGFTGSYSAGEHVEDEDVDGVKIPMVSLYGAHKKPTAEDLADVDVVLFDLQDVGVRFYTYISTLTYVMEACAEQKKPLIVLDRPNPFANVVDGPVLDTAFTSFVGLHPVPVLYGMTMGEYAQMVKGEGWIREADSLQLRVILCVDYHREPVSFPDEAPPSPNLPNAHAIALYPSLCFFEAAPVSVGRGTEAPFEWLGAPWMDSTGFSFVPMPNAGASAPKFQGDTCQGWDLRTTPIHPEQGLQLTYLHDVYHAYMDQGGDTLRGFFTSFMDKLAGGTSLEDALVAGQTVEEIQASWKPDLAAFKELRSRYLLYSTKPLPTPVEATSRLAPAKKAKKATKKGAR
jgi:uncharacterized protein YbbC (DUF1343 family)